MRMSWLPRLQIALFGVGIVGMLFLIFGHWESGWSIAYFAWGMVIAVGCFLLNLIVSGVTAIFQPRLRKVSIWIAAVSLLMLLGLVLPRLQIALFGVGIVGMLFIIFGPTAGRRGD
jgi:hypothetical protein